MALTLGLRIYRGHLWRLARQNRVARESRVTTPTQCRDRSHLVFWLYHFSKCRSQLSSNRRCHRRLYALMLGNRSSPLGHINTTTALDLRGTFDSFGTASSDCHLRGTISCGSVVTDRFGSD